MHRSEAEEYAICASCGAEVATTERTYSFGLDEILCFRCATDRQGQYDEGHDQWTVAPRIEDLLERTAQEV